MFITNPERFAAEFNQTVPGAYRQISAEDVRLMTQCGLIGRYKYYLGTDLQTVIGILQYELLRKKQSAEQDKEDKPHCCKICGKELLPEPEGKAGRHKEYCSGCELHRNRDRQKRFKYRRRKTHR